MVCWAVALPTVMVCAWADVLLARGPVGFGPCDSEERVLDVFVYGSFHCWLSRC